MVRADREGIRVLHSRRTWLNKTETWLHNQVKYLPAEVVSYVACERTENLDVFALPRLHSLTRHPWQHKVLYRLSAVAPLRRRWMQRLIRQQGISIVHSHFGNEGWVDRHVKQKTAARHVVSFYGFDASRLPQQQPIWYERYHELFASVDAVLCEGPFMAQAIIQQLGCPPQKMHVQRLGIDVDTIAYQPRHWTPAEPLRVLIAATFTEKKGIPYALEALGILAATQALEITLIGDASTDAQSQAEKQNILAVLRRYDLLGKTRLLGFQPHARMIAEAYQHHVFLSPSVTAHSGDTEGGAPVGIIEMAASGMPVVSTNHCDIPQVIEHGVTGLLAEERDATGLVQNLRWLLANPQGWQPMTQAARQHIEDKFDARQQGSALARIYEQVLDQRP